MYEQHKNLIKRPRTWDHDDKQHYKYEQQKCLTWWEDNVIEVLECQIIGEEESNVK